MSLDFDKYKTKLTYPKKPDKICPGCGTDLYQSYKKLGAELNFCTKCGFAVKEHFVRLKDQYDRLRDEYNDNLRELDSEFKRDALTEVGLMDHPKMDQIYEYAYDKGNGYSEIFSELETLSHLFKD